MALVPSWSPFPTTVSFHSSHTVLLSAFGRQKYSALGSLAVSLPGSSFPQIFMWLISLPLSSLLKCQLPNEYYLNRPSCLTQNTVHQPKISTLFSPILMYFFSPHSTYYLLNILYSVLIHYTYFVFCPLPLECTLLKVWNVYLCCSVTTQNAQNSGIHIVGT